MNEEIDIIELLQRVKEGKAPKKIEINETEYVLTGVEEFSIYFLYKKADSNSPVYWFFNDYYINFDTKIKILDKPIIEELKPVKIGNVVTIPERDILFKKINEIIEVLNGRNL